MLNYRLRENATKILKLQAELLSELETMIEEQDSSGDAGLTALTKLQADQIYWQDRFIRLAYLTGEVYGSS